MSRRLTSELELVQYIKGDNYECNKLSCCGGKRVMVLSRGRGRFVNALNHEIPCPFQRKCGKFPPDEPLETSVVNYLKEHESVAHA